MIYLLLSKDEARFFFTKRKKNPDKSSENVQKASGVALVYILYYKQTNKQTAKDPETSSAIANPVCGGELDVVAVQLHATSGRNDQLLVFKWATFTFFYKFPNKKQEKPFYTYLQTF